MPESVKIDENVKTKSLLKSGFKALLCLIGVVVVILVIAILFLRSQSGLNFVLGKTKSALSAKGLVLDYAEAKGPLPGHLFFKNVTLKDPQGLFLEVESLELKLKTWKLLSLTVEAELLDVVGLDFKRAPVMEKKETKEPSGPLNIPVSIIVNLDISRSKLLSATQGEGDSLLDVKGKVSYIKNSGLLWDIVASWEPKGTKCLRLVSQLTQDSLKLDLDLALVKNGPLEFLTKDLRLPWGEGVLLVRASGPLESFKGTLTFTDPAPPYEPKADTRTPLATEGSNVGVGESQDLKVTPGIYGTFELSSEEGTTFHALLSNPDLARSLHLTLKSTPGFPLPKGLENMAGDNLMCDLTMDRGKEQGFTGKLFMSSDKGEAHLSPIDLNFEDGSVELSLEGDFAFVPPSKLSLAAPEPEKKPSVPPKSVASDKGHPIYLAPPQAFTEASATNLITAQAAYTLPMDGRPLGYPNASFLLAQNAAPKEILEESADTSRLKGRISLKLKSDNGVVEVPKLNITGEGLDLSATGSYRGTGGASDLNLNLKLDKGERFTRLIPALKEGLNSDALINLILSYDMEKESVERGELTAKLSDLGGLLADVKGEGEVSLDFKGGLKDKLVTDLSVSSPKITRTTKEGSLDFIEPLVTVKGNLGNLLSAPGFDGEVKAQSKDKEGSELLNFKATPKLSFQPEGFQGELKELSLEGMGAIIKGQMQVSRPMGSKPNLNGDLDLTLNSFDDLKVLTGLDLKGEPLKLSLNFKKDENPQTISGKLENKSFSLSSLKLTDTQLDFSALSPWENPNLSLKLNTSAGEASMFKWTKGEITVSDFSKDGLATVTLSFLEDSKRELLSLTGTYNRASNVVTLNNLKFSPPKLKDQLILKKPVTLTLKGTSRAIATTGEAITDKAQNPMSISGLSLSLGKAQIELEGDLSPMKANLSVKELPLSVMSMFTEITPPEGSVNLDLHYASGGNATLKLDTNPSIKRENGPPLTFKFTSDAKLEGGRRLVGEGALTLPGPAGRTPLDIKYQLPFMPSGDLVTPDFTGPLTASLNWKGDIATLWGFLNLPDRTLKGNTEIDIDIGGTLRKPIPSANVYLANSNYDDNVLSLYLNDINLEAKADNSGEKIIVVADAKDSTQGTIALEGTITLGKEPTLSSRGQIKRLAPFHRDDFNVTLSALFSINGPFSNLTISTKAVVEALEVNLSTSIGGPSIATLSLDKGFQPSSSGPALDISIDIPRGAYIRGRGLDSEWKGNIQISGSTGAPILNGSLNPIRGFFTLLGKEFTFSGGGITFRNHRRLNPGLDIELHRNVSDLTAIVRVQGTLDSPKIKFESNPPYPQDEVLAQVLFGKPASELSRFETIQLANSLRELAGVGSNMPNPLATMRDALGLSVLRIGEATSNADRHMEGNNFRQNLDLDDDDESSSQSDTAPTLEAGKYITDNIYVGVDQNLVNNTTGVRVEIELAPNVNLTSRSSDTSSRVGIGWKHDY
ncbi:MAG: translocation/assembly module TamB domain-containing protein [Deltaproteobacteria bacterium]|jgi:translocation and assembly module TamB|nr:translocation/assembly module TamB domain-containing protein [Deltaproteobacteria bacterium]